MRQAACFWLFATFPSSVIPALSRNPATACPRGEKDSLSPRTWAGWMPDPVRHDGNGAQKNRHETSVCPHSIPLLPFSRPPLFEKIPAQGSGMAKGSPETRSGYWNVIRRNIRSCLTKRPLFSFPAR
ncbi:hypothetical protein CFBP5877_16145 [Agrobacterium tumefaciens]|uniref:Uncharacterized protein n=1 Tax=Agrobacterium tumefaciens TaxID=358 RepID=A0AAE6BEW8_AGRTU|nr:hypothetical protein CFBP5499_16605 [Agrobacterium tumefaciens]QCL80700.1 hypothetical protein CFBP5877_16145 [Agrobacterium tumefaciens]